MIYTTSPFTSSIWPAQKTDRSWRMIVDYHKLNPMVTAIITAIPDVAFSLEQINTTSGIWYEANDLTNIFFLKPVSKNYPKLFAFSCKGLQYTLTILPQWYINCLVLNHNLVYKDMISKEKSEHQPRIFNALLRKGLHVFGYIQNSCIILL